MLFVFWFPTSHNSYGIICTSLLPSLLPTSLLLTTFFLYIRLVRIWNVYVCLDCKIFWYKTWFIGWLLTFVIVRPWCLYLFKGVSWYSFDVRIDCRMYALIAECTHWLPNVSRCIYSFDVRIASECMHWLPKVSRSCTTTLLNVSLGCITVFYPTGVC